MVETNFDLFPEELKKIVIDLEKNYQVIKKIPEEIPEGILLNPELYKKCQSQIDAIYNPTEQKFINFLFSLNRSFLSFNAILNHYYYIYPEREEKKLEVTPISTPTKEVLLQDEKEIGFLGYPQSHPSKMGEEGGEVEVSENIVRLPFKEVKKALEKRKEKFGIYISQEGMRHFERLKCNFESSDPIFGKIEKALNHSLKYGRNGWFTPINDVKREELKLSFSVQITRTGWILLHLQGRKKDAEKFSSDFFKIFKEQCGLSDAEIVEVLNKFKASNEERIFSAYIHDARYIDPKEIVQPEFNGAHVKVGLGKEGWEAYVDFSERSRAHFEGKGPTRKVENMLNLMSGVDEYVECQEEAFQFSLKNYDIATETRWELYDLSKTFKNNYQDQMHYLSEIEVTNDNRHLQNQILLTGISHQVQRTNKLNLETLSEIREYSDFAKDSFEKIHYPLNILTKSSRRIAVNMSKLARNLGNMGSIIPVVQEDIKDTIDHRSNQTDQLIIDSSREIIDKIESKTTELKETIKTVIATEIKTNSEALKTNLETIIALLEKLPGLTAKEIAHESELKTRTVYNYLNKLRENGLITESVIKSSKRGRPNKLVALSNKIINKLKKGE